MQVSENFSALQNARFLVIGPWMLITLCSLVLLGLSAPRRFLSIPVTHESHDIVCCVSDTLLSQSEEF
ncbi:hypothetical protein L207DRAFT_117667 [Hyaloscypha variabilis F]|uniref:Uncharacterized protein n=1 Tax=Hyaloscypha variabilis (strain UAMH 11265 / GT02V1 / F) TaxID=1149755 RepID=A0A2J6RAK9_HYAVF|nr:hypothetical protein L207DRAFT_117667 [Hyaloscypha variabilis F]